MSLQYIDQQVLKDQSIQQNPFPWCRFDHLIRREKQRELYESYPTNYFVPSSRLQGDKKNYRFNVFKIIHHNQRQDNYLELAQGWRSFIDELSSTQYLSQLFALFSIETQQYHLDISLFRFGVSDWVEPHVDHEDKLLTQLFYFNDNWLTKWGGLLLLHSEPTPNKVFDYFVPCLAHAIAIQRVPNAWHSVTPVTPNATQDRLTLQVEIWK